MKVRDLIHMLESAGWRLKRTRGGHRQFSHPTKGMVVNVPVGTLKAILRSAGLEKKGEQ
jgi:predicted RNA binding protein YcfA (HicA-like mRNA interferase family)